MKKFFKTAGLIVTLFCLILILIACGADKTSQSSDGTQSTENAQKEPSIDLGEDLKWPKDFMGNLPEPSGKITAVISDETNELSTIDFRAYKENGDWVHAYWTLGEDKNTASIMMEKAE